MHLYLSVRRHAAGFLARVPATASQGAASGLLERGEAVTGRSSKGVLGQSSWLATPADERASSHMRFYCVDLP